LWRLDLAFADIISTTTDPMLGAIRMAWWRERLDELDSNGKVPAEPRLQAVAHELLPRGIRGGELSHLENGWVPLLQPFPWTELVAEGLELRGRLLFGLGGRLLGGDADAESAGALWSLADGARHCSDADSREMLEHEARHALAALPRRARRRVRPLTILAAVSAADLLSGGSPCARLAAALRHRAFGTFPHS
jgi:phytoene synthase